ncbi:MAG: response regulator [Algicola sp.]|nr:response regulator [Algicola sp.]
MSNQNIVLAVDDEPFNLEILEEILSDGYQFHSAKSGPECLEVVTQLNPSVILLDVSMPDMDGYEVCRRLKNTEDTKDIPVMFVSARGALDERIEGYNAGGEDYIVKPFAREELEAKLRGLFRIQEHQKELECQVQQATEMAFSAMSNSSEVGIVMQFVERTQELHSVEALSSALLETLSAYGLAASMEIRPDNAPIQHFCSHGSISPIVVELFDLLKSKGRIYSFEPRMMINYRQLSILLMNMPQTDEEKMGRLRDHLCFISSSAEQCLSAIMTELQLEAQKKALKETIGLVKAKFEDLVWVLNESHSVNETIFKELQEQFESHIPGMGLEDDQEQYIYRSLDKTIQKSVAREDQVMNIKSTFFEIEDDLNNLLGKE